MTRTSVTAKTTKPSRADAESEPEAVSDEPGTSGPENSAVADGLSLKDTFAAFRGHVRPHWREIAIAAVLLVGAGVLGLLQPLVVEDLLTAYAQGGDVAPDLLKLVALVLVAAVALAVGDFVLLLAAEGVVLAGRHGLVRHILRLPMGAMRRQATGDLLARAAGDTSLLRQIVTQTLHHQRYQHAHGQRDPGGQPHRPLPFGARSSRSTNRPCGPCAGSGAGRPLPACASDN